MIVDGAGALANAHDVLDSVERSLDGRPPRGEEPADPDTWGTSRDAQDAMRMAEAMAGGPAGGWPARPD